MALLAALAGAAAAAPAQAQQQRVALSADDPLAASIPAEGRIAFRVLREDVEIGRHALAFRRLDQRLEVEVVIDLNVTFLGVSLYRYSHRARETWQDGRLVALETATDNNGKPFKVSGEAVEGGFAVRADGRTQIMPADVLPSSHWNRAWLNSRALLNTQTGERIEFSVSARGRETIDTASGPIAAERFAIAGDLRKEIWFDAAGRWVKTSFAAPDGSTISYVLQ